MKIFTDGSSFVQDGKCKAGDAVVTAEQVLESKSLPQGTSALLAELEILEDRKNEKKQNNNNNK